ncbi:MAG TPA: RDD family protein [Frankiaceae bacterium]|jgi:uncharacterized RDD family membrane protein YckC|nr:RDD family protein [Frankiaceae bacterium]
MARAIGSWLSGPPVPTDFQPGVRLGLPADGPGSVATIASRLGAFVIDAIVANLLAGLPYLFGARYSPTARGYVILGAFLVVELIFDAIYGQTLGKRVLGIRVIRVDGDGLGSLPWLLLRTVLLGVLIPAVVWDRDRRGLHDKAAGVVVVVDPNKVAATRRPATPKAAVKAATPAAPAPPAAGPARTPKKAPAAPARSARRKRRR